MSRMFDDPNGLVEAISAGTKIRLEDIRNDGWESPIRTCVQTMQNQVESEMVVKIKQAIGVDIDKKRLMEALEYSHQSWLDGYAAGQKDAVKHGHWILCHPQWDWKFRYNECSLCNAQCQSQYRFCPSCGAKMDEEVNE